jgi:hypothetical protein
MEEMAVTTKDINSRCNYLYNPALIKRGFFYDIFALVTIS